MTAVAGPPAGGSWAMLSSWGISTAEYVLYTLVSGILLIRPKPRATVAAPSSDARIRPARQVSPWFAVGRRRR